MCVCVKTMAVTKSNYLFTSIFAVKIRHRKMLKRHYIIVKDESNEFH